MENTYEAIEDDTNILKNVIHNVPNTENLIEKYKGQHL